MISDRHSGVHAAQPLPGMQGASTSPSENPHTAQGQETLASTVSALSDDEAMDCLVDLHAWRPRLAPSVIEPVLANVLQRLDHMGFLDILHVVSRLAALPYASARSIVEQARVRMMSIHEACIQDAVRSGIFDDYAQALAALAAARGATLEICRLERFLEGHALQASDSDPLPIGQRHRELTACALADTDITALRQIDARLNGSRYIPSETRFELKESFAGVPGAQMIDRRVVEAQMVVEDSWMALFGRDESEQGSADACMFRQEVGLALRPAWRESGELRSTDLFGASANPGNLERLHGRIPESYLNFLATLDTIKRAQMLPFARVVELLAPYEVFSTDRTYAQQLQDWGGNGEPLRWDLSSLQNISPLNRAAAATALLAPARAEIERRITAVGVKANLMVTR